MTPSVRQTVLVVHREPHVSRSIESTLRLVGYEVVSAAEVQQVLGIIKHRQVRLMILDMQMLYRHSLDRTIRTEAANRQIPVLALVPRAKDAALFQDWHADAYLAVPFSPDDLVGFVRRLTDDDEGCGVREPVR